MKTITDAQTAYRWLRERAEQSPAKRAAGFLFDVIYDSANEDFDRGRFMRGLDLEFWIPIMEGLAGDPALSKDVDMAEPVAVFVGNLLADLATRGSAGAVSVEQAIIMLLHALDWTDDFRFKPATKHRHALIKSRRRFEKKSGVAILIGVDPGKMADLHFSF